MKYDPRATDLDDASLDLFAAAELCLRAAQKLDALAGCGLAGPIHAALVAAEAARAKLGREAEPLGDPLPSELNATDRVAVGGNGHARRVPPPAAGAPAALVAVCRALAAGPLSLKELQAKVPGVTPGNVSALLTRYGPTAAGRPRYFDRPRYGVHALTAAGRAAFGL